MEYYDEASDTWSENSGSDYVASQGGNDNWFWDEIGIDPGSIDYGGGTPPTNDQILKDIGYQDPTIVTSISKLLSQAGPAAVGFLKKQFIDPKTGDVNWRSVAAAAGGLYGAYQSQQAQPKTGYQGGIPKYEAVRESVPGTYDPNRRAGSGGQQYFTDTKYVAPGEAATAARAAAKEEAAGLAALNRSNPARQSATAAAVEKGEESRAVIEENRRASDVIQDKPVPKYATGGILALAKGGAPQYLSGTTDGMEDKIPARIDGGQEARLSHGEFVIPADVVGHLGNGNSEAGAKRLYDMMDRIRNARTGTPKQGKQINPNKFLPS